MSLPAPVSRDQCIAEFAQHRADAHQRLAELVRRVGTEEAAELLWQPWRAISKDELRQRLAAQFGETRVPARTGAA